jgi:GntR family transcriptional regulator
MDIVISATSDKPIYRQLFEQISAQILNRRLKEGYCLPPIRSVAKELEISVITVKKAWEDLERGGFIITMAGKGCFVAKLDAADLTDKRTEMALSKLKKDIDYYKSLGLSKDDLLKLIRKEFPK